MGARADFRASSYHDGIWRHFLSTRCARKELPRARAVDRPFQCREFLGRARRGQRLGIRAARSDSESWRNHHRCPGDWKPCRRSDSFRSSSITRTPPTRLLNVLKTLRELSPRKSDRRLRLRRRSRSAEASAHGPRWSIRMRTSASSPRTIRGKKIPMRSSPKSKKDFARIITKRLRIARKRSRAPSHWPSRATSC